MVLLRGIVAWGCLRARQYYFEWAKGTGEDDLEPQWACRV